MKNYLITQILFNRILFLLVQTRKQIPNTTFDKALIPVEAYNFIYALDVLFKAHYLFNLQYNVELKAFYNFLQTVSIK